MIKWAFEQNTVQCGGGEQFQGHEQRGERAGRGCGAGSQNDQKSGRHMEVHGGDARSKNYRTRAAVHGVSGRRGNPAILAALDGMGEL